MDIYFDQVLKMVSIYNLMYPELPDSCAAACEIARRGHRKYVTGFFYPMY